MQGTPIGMRAGLTRRLLAVALVAGALGLTGEAAAQGYQVATDPVGMSSIETSQGVQTLVDVSGRVDSDEVATVQLPFPFEFFGVAVTSVDISSNGVVSFEPLVGQFPAFENQSLSPFDSTAPNAAIAVMWKDLEEPNKHVELK